MATKSFLSFLRFRGGAKVGLSLGLAFAITSCESVKSREQIKTQTHAQTRAESQGSVKKAETAPNIPDALKPSLETSSAITESGKGSEKDTGKDTAKDADKDSDKQVPSASAALAPKIGLILGPGSARAFAHVGVVQELAKAKLPITHVVGFEMGALVGAIYAAKAQPFDVEWQMFKLKDFKSVAPLLQGVFQNQKAEDFKIPFACPAFNLAKQQNFMMNKGTVTQMLPYCLSYPPLLKPYSQNVAGVTELKTAIDYLKAKGANYIIYVHVLNAKAGVLTGGLEDDSNVLWSLASLNLSKQWQAVDYVISVPVQDFDLLSFDQRRQIMQKGIEAGQTAASQIARRLGL